MDHLQVKLLILKRRKNNMAEKKEQKFEDKLSELEKIVLDIESGEIPLEDAINKFNEAMILANDCDKTLKDATKTVQKILDQESNKLKEFNPQD